MKEFVVIGLGNFGAMVARKLAELGCKVTAIDTNKTLIQSIQEFASQAIVADASDAEFLKNLEVEHFDSFIVSTGQNSHAAILIALHLRELGAKRIIVKANSADHAKILLKVGADEVVIPEEEMAIKIARNLAQPNILDYLPLSEEYSIAEVVPTRRLIGKSLADAKLRSEYRVEVIAIRDVVGEKLTFVPSPAYKIKDSDILIVLGKEDDIEKIRE